VPLWASSRGMVDRLYIIIGLRESDRSGERLWGERQGEGLTGIVEGHQQDVMATGAVFRVSLGYRAAGCRVPRGPPQRQIASHVDRQQPADILPRVSSSNSLFRSGTVSPVPPPPGRRRWFTPLRQPPPAHLSLPVSVGVEVKTPQLPEALHLRLLLGIGCTRTSQTLTCQGYEIAKRRLLAALVGRTCVCESSEPPGSACV
jgi:hypothetical protein